MEIHNDTDNTVDTNDYESSFQNKWYSRGFPSNTAPPTEEHRNIDIQIKDGPTLEQEVVQERAPIGCSEPINFLRSSYKSVSSNVNRIASF